MNGDFSKNDGHEGVPSRSRPFRPSRPQQAYLEAWLDPHAPKTISGISRHIAVPRRTIQNWLTNDAFVQWFNRELEKHVEVLWRPVLLKVAELALKGSIQHARLLAQVRGVMQPAGRECRGSVTVVIGVPRP